jgi:hypothetical protein
MPRIYFTSGKTMDIDDDEFRKMPPKLQYGGVRLWRLKNGSFIPLNSNTIELVEKETPEDMERAAALKKVQALADQMTEAMADTEETPVPADVPEEFEKKEIVQEETIQQRRDRQMQEMLDKSNCTHVDKVLYKQDTKQGTKHFPVCTFCGKRERFVSVKKIKEGKLEDWTMQDVVDAKDWQEK